MQQKAEQLRVLLEQAGSAHHEFEEGDLGGVRDEDWPGWYARYLLGNGLAGITAYEFSLDELARLLQACDSAYQRDQPQEKWPDYYARRILASAGGE